MNRKYKQTRAALSAIGALLLAALLLMGSILPSAAAAPAAAAGGLPREVYVGGMPFGVKFYTEGILVVGFCDVDTPAGSGVRQVNPAREAGLQVRDVITGINGEPPANATSLTRAVEESAGSPITLTVKRCTNSGDGSSHRKGHGQRATTEMTVSITPSYSASENRYKTGLWVRDSGAGIGTVTFIVPGSNAFGGLGHGICDADTGELIPMQRGQVTDVTVSGVERGEVGDPGAIKGYFAPGKTGSLLGNTDCGVYGLFATLPREAGTKLPVGSKQDIRVGEATILCTLDDGQIGSYVVQITAIDPTATGSKCFTLTVTDPALTQKTGGIVQGMSGSPVLQDGKLVGAVTHVLISDPTSGYGIFIENMLARMPNLLR